MKVTNLVTEIPSNKLIMSLTLIIKLKALCAMFLGLKPRDVTFGGTYSKRIYLIIVGLTIIYSLFSNLIIKYLQYKLFF